MEAHAEFMVNRVFGVNMKGVSVACLTLVAVFLAAAITARKLPPYIHTCNPLRPDWSKCLLRAVEDVRPYLPGGIPEMHIPRLEPLLVSAATLDSGNFLASFQNIYVSGLTKFLVRDIDFDFDKNVGKLLIDFDQIDIISDYLVKGRILILDVNGNGKSNATFYKPSGTATLQGHRKNVNGKEYIVFDKINLDIKFNGGKMYFADLFRGNPELTENTNRIINDNIDDILSDLKPIINKTIGDIILHLVRQVFERFSVDELFPN